MSSISYWLREIMPTYPMLEGEHRTEVVVLGGGIVGLTTALLLKQAGVKVILLEAGQIARGTSGHTTAKVTAQHELCYSQILPSWGQEAARLYAKTQTDAIRGIATLVQALDIDCDWLWQNAHLFALHPEGEEKLEKEQQAAQRAGLAMQLTLGAGDFPLPARAILGLSNQAAFHPVKYMRALAGALQNGGNTIYEKSRALAVDIPEGVVHTAEGRVKADWIIVATHYPIINVPGLYFAKMMVKRSCAMMLDEAPAVKGMYLSVDPEGYSLRMQGDGLIFGGAGYDCGREGDTDHYAVLEQAAKQYFPQARPTYYWSAQDCMPPDHLPYIGAYAKNTPHVLVATGFAKWGMTNSMVAAQLLRDRVLAKQNDAAWLFSPQRTQRHAAKGVTKQILSTAGGMLSGVARLGSPFCTHMGCKLQWNRDEQSWDCPCHGSRFDRQGHILEGPAKKCPHSKHTC